MNLRIWPPVILTLLLSSLPSQSLAVLAPSKDNTLYQDPAGGLSNALGSHLFAGGNALGELRRALIAFDVAGTIPAGSRIVSASLTLNLSRTISGTVQVSLHRLLADWGEGTSAASLEEGTGAPATPGDATWIHRFFPGTNWAVPGGDFVAAASVARGVGMLGPYTWNSTPALVADVQGWLDNPSQNFGWAILGQESPSTAKRFDSRENPVPGLRPQLSINYVPPTATVTVLGQGCTGSSGKPFAHGATGLPFLGNAAFGLTAADGPAQGLCLFLIAAASSVPPLPITPGCLLQVEAIGILILGSLFLDPSGAAALPLPIPPSPWFAGVSVYTQAIALDPPAPGGLVVSGGLRLFLAP